MSKYKRKWLESDLQGLDVFRNPKSSLEQYCTPPRLAADIIHAVDEDIHLSGKAVLDLGCGCGILGLGCAIVGANKVLGVDIDDEAITVAKQNRDRFSIYGETVSFIQQDVQKLIGDSLPAGLNKFDIVITNPPFGIRALHSKNIDQCFVRKGLEFAGIVYCIHKSSIRKFWIDKAKELNASVDFLIQEVSFTIDRTYRFHKHDEHDIVVDLMKFSKK